MADSVLNQDDFLFVEQDVISILPFYLIQKHLILPLKFEENSVVVATTDDTNIFLRDLLEQELGFKVLFIKEDIYKIQNSILKYYGNLDQVFEALQLKSDNNDSEFTQNEVSQRVLTPESLMLIEGEPSIPQLFEVILYQAILNRASDIHIEPGRDQSLIRFRIDGQLHVFKDIPKSYHKLLVSVIKIEAKMDIIENRLPQDGQFEIQLNQKSISFRVATLNTVEGEKITLRVLEKNLLNLNLGDLGIHSDQIRRIQHIMKRSTGMFLVSGPTGSGKTTTLYTCLKEVASLNRNILSVEDPVEYRIDLMNQSQVIPEIDLTFERTCRSFLRHDPDIIFIGEIRDQQTAHIGVQNALVGALMMGTIHSNDACRTINRLLNLDIPPFLIASTLSCVMSQRLVRKICPHCQHAYEPDDDVLKALGLPKSGHYIKGKGCDHCFHTGFKGRIAITELLENTPGVQRIIESSGTAFDILEQAKTEGFKTLKEDALQKISDHLTTPEEVAIVLSIL